VPPDRGRVGVWALSTAALLALALEPWRLALFAQGAGPNSYPNPYQLVETWMQLPGVAGGMWPEHQVVGIGFDKDANIILFQRADPPFLKFDSSGRKILKTWGDGMYVEPHGFRSMPDGSVWGTDANVKDGVGGQVIHFSADGQVLLTLGTKGVLGEGADKFLGPTGVAIAKIGDVFVSDGHRGGGNHGVVRFSKDGQFIKSWGTAGSGPGQFNGAHSIGIDSQGRIFVCDRGNNRIQIFDQDGRLLDEWKQFGRPETILITTDDTMYVPDTQSNSRSNPGFRRGIRIGSAKNGSVKYFIPDPEPEPDRVQTSAAVAVAVDPKGNLYTSEVWSDANVGLAKMLKKYMKN
jgi:sugar lactone lactonase YvrE